MKTNWLIITLGTCLTIGATFSPTAFAQDGTTMPPRTGSFLDSFAAHRIERKLNITDAQRTQLRTILQTEKPNITALALRLHDENQQLIAKDTFDEPFIRSVAAQHDVTMTDVLVEREKVRTEVLQVLTPEQRAKLKQLRAQIGDRFAARFANAPDQLGAGL